MEVLKALYNWRINAYKTWVKIHVCKKLKVHDITKSGTEKRTATLEVISQSMRLKNAQLLRDDITKPATEKRTAT